ncbi:hypothetical protein PV326_000612, partial [Microctonus aethiopoides]
KQMKNEVEIQKYTMRAKDIFEVSARTAGVGVRYDNFRFWRICKPMGWDCVGYPTPISQPRHSEYIYIIKVGINYSGASQRLALNQSGAEAADHEQRDSTSGKENLKKKTSNSERVTPFFEQ